VAKEFSEIAFTPRVQALQARYGSRKAYAQRSAAAAPQVLGPDERAFVESRDSFYIATVGETGWPYIQHRGGPQGFLRVLDERTLAFADFRGNKQYISAGNVAGDDRAALFLMDYPSRTRLKFFVRVRLVERAENPELLDRLAVPGYDGKVERAFVLSVEGFDWNCPQHITPRYTAAEIEEAVAPLKERIAELERELALATGNASVIGRP
jgi:predicted pyridoxine 5'-phosphate oxidase superfamily flavin-nucleotide-binding protein